MTTFVRAWNLAAVLLLLRPWWAGEDVGVAIVIGTFAGAVAYTVLYGGVRVIDRLEQRHGGSTPPASTGVVAQSARVPACHAGGRGFESRPLRSTSTEGEIMRIEPINPPLREGQTVVCARCGSLCHEEAIVDLDGPPFVHYCNLACFRRAKRAAK